MNGETITRTLLGVSVLVGSTLSMLVAIPDLASAYTFHAPILIAGNSDFTAANGVVGGSGSASDPYIIGGWEIDASTSTGISVMDTDAHFEIQDVLVRDGGTGGTGYTGIFFQRVANGVITRANITRNNRAIMMESASDIVISDSNLSYNHNGVQIRLSSRISIRNVTSWMDISGSFDLVDSSNVTITDCCTYITGIMTGTRIFSSGSDLLIEKSTFSGGYYDGIRLNGATRVEIRNNVIRDVNGHGILIETSSRISIHDNDLTRNGHPAPAGFAGVKVYGSDSVFIFRNNFTLNQIGVGLAQAGPDQSNNVIIHHNNFTANVVQAVQEFYSVVGDAWDDGYPSGGNYWGDYSGWDNYSGVSQNQQGSDGVGDTPYGIFEDARDRYPLMEPGGIVNSPPVPQLAVTPQQGNISVVFGFNASASHDAEDSPDLLTVRWDFEGDTTWETSWSTTKTAQYQYAAPGTYAARLEVKDTIGSIVGMTRMVWVNNTPPIAAITFTPLPGNPPPYSIGVEASLSTDLEDSVDLLSVRWDWEDDGVWDTTWSTWKGAEYRYLAPGTYTIRLQVMDTGGLISATTRQVVFADVVTPVITHSPSGDSSTGHEIVITAIVTDDAGVEAVYLHYKTVGSSTFMVMKMTKMAGDYYMATIPAQSQAGTVYYYINATDATGNEARHPQTGVHEFSVVQKENPPLSNILIVLTIAVATAIVIAIVIVIAFFFILKKRKNRVKAEGFSANETNSRPSASPPKQSR